MKNRSDQLKNVQTMFHVLYTLVRVAKTLCIVGASLCAVSVLCMIVTNHGGRVFGLFGEPVDLLAGVPDGKAAGAELSAACIQLSARAVLLALAQSYLKSEQADGTPFTEQGADRLKLLGIYFIWISIVAAVLAAVAVVLLGAAGAGTMGNRTEVVTGIVLILTSVVFRYGAELEP